MKVRMLTAHGYLSFQPPLGGDPNGIATLQYRPTAGAWEELDLEGWDFERPVAPPDTRGAIPTRATGSGFRRRRAPSMSPPSRPTSSHAG